MSLGGGNIIFSSFDLLSGYWQVLMAKESREITAFSTPTGHYQWPRMPFDLKSAPLTFQWMITTLFTGMLGNTVYVYLGDVIMHHFFFGVGFFFLTIVGFCCPWPVPSLHKEKLLSHTFTFSFPAIARSRSPSKTVKMRVFEVKKLPF